MSFSPCRFWINSFLRFRVGDNFVARVRNIFPIDVAVALTAIVHLLNNFFKLMLLGKHADKKTVIKFGFPAIVAAFIEAWFLVSLSGMKPIVTYNLMSYEFNVLPAKLVVVLL